MMFGHGVRTFALSEPDALAAELPCGCVRAVPLRCGPMAVHLTRIGLGDVLLQTARSTPLAMLGVLPQATVLLILPLGGGGTVVLNGRALKPRCVVGFGAGARYEAASSSDCACAMIALSAATAGAFLGRRNLPPALRRGDHALLCASAAPGRLLPRRRIRLFAHIPRCSAAFEPTGPVSRAGLRAEFAKAYR
jgi:hypothetical protein